MNTILPPPAPYPIDAFLSVVRDAGWELQQNVQAPDALIGMALVSAITTACQAQIDVRMPTGRVRPVSQNVLVVAESGERKSTVDSLVFAPMYERDVSAVMTHLEEGGVQNPSKRGKETKKLRLTMHQDISSRAIMEALQGHGESIALISDEGQVLLQGPAMKNLGLLNRLWDCPKILSLSRARRDQVLVVDPRLSVNLMTQQGPLREYIEKYGNRARHSGHWARYLVGWPASMMGYRPVNHSEASWSCLQTFHARIDELLGKQASMRVGGSVERKIIEFSDDARARWFSLANQTEWMLRHGEFLHDINDFASKVMEILARLAATMHYFAGEAGDVTLDTLERAFAIVNWHVNEYKRMFSVEFAMPQERVDAQCVATYLRTHVWRGIGSDSFVAKNHLLRCGPVRTRDRLDPALGMLEYMNAIRIETAPKDKRRYVRLNDAYFGSM